MLMDAAINKDTLLSLNVNSNLWGISDAHSIITRTEQYMPLSVSKI